MAPPRNHRVLEDAQRAQGGLLGETLHGEKLLRWLAADGARVRRPIVVTGAKVTLGFSEAAREELEGAL